MSLMDEAKMPSLKDKIRQQGIKQSEEAKEVVEVEGEEVKVRKGRRLNK